MRTELGSIGSSADHQGGGYRQTNELRMAAHPQASHYWCATVHILSFNNQDQSRKYQEGGCGQGRKLLTAPGQVLGEGFQ